MEPNLLPHRAIKTSDEYQMALFRIETLFFAERGTPSGDELELWLDLLDAYEQEHFPIDVGE